jgi:hypothetical protein
VIAYLGNHGGYTGEVMKPRSRLPLFCLGGLAYGSLVQVTDEYYDVGFNLSSVVHEEVTATAIRHEPVVPAL